MIKLISVQVFKYKSIDNSTPVIISPDVTVLVGKNESGKTAFLEALYKALPLNSVTRFNPVFDYPKKEYVRYRSQHEAKSYAKVVDLHFQIESDLADRINKELFNGVQIVQAGHDLSRTTDYANSNTIGFNVDQAKAVAALKKGLGDLEFAEEVFTGADRLETVLARIEAKNLEQDSKLAIFAKRWRASAIKPAGWGLVDGYIWSSYVSPSVPQFLYFDDYRILDGKINLQSLNQRKVNNSLTEADETALGLFELAGTNVDELLSEGGYEDSKAKLEAIGLSITDQVFEYWRQNQELAVEFDVKDDPKDEPPFNNGKNLYIRVKNLRHGVTVPFDQRSKGFIWFFSFMVWFSAIENRVGAKRDLILLLDEPGLNLHALAQSDFLAYIDKLSETRQIIYTTHSPFMVKSEALQNVRVVEDRLKEGTKISGDLAGSSEESLFPLQAALGYSIAQNLFIAKKNLLVEGPADLLLLQHMSSLLEQQNKIGLLEGVYVPVGGLDKLATFIALLGANKLKLAVLHDRASSPNQGLENTVRQKLIERKRIMDFSLFRHPENLETDIEDLFPENLYIEAFNAAYSKELNKALLLATDLPQHPRIVERINKWLSNKNIVLMKDGGFNHYRVAQSLLPKLTETSLNSSDFERFEALFERVNTVLK